MHKIAILRLNCRICGSESLEEILNFGEMALTGVFRKNGADVDKAPLVLVRCGLCGLVQLQHTYDQSSLYGETYGYESHLNAGMVKHLKQKAMVLEQKYLKSVESPIVVDIASNDGTLLSGYSSRKMTRVGIDPLISIVEDHYPTDSVKIESFFSSEEYFKAISKPANLVTSLSVLYDLDDPVNFARGVHDILTESGIWHFEQSYLPTMVNTLSYDTICHEHLLYLSLSDIVRVLNSAGLQLLDATLNSTNGGSVAVTAIKSSKEIELSPFVKFLLQKENKEGYGDNSRMIAFAKEAHGHKEELRKLLNEFTERGFEVVGLGASTKGNVLLQWLNLDSTVLKKIGDVNNRKFGSQTPGSSIPIVPEAEIISEAHPKTLAVVLPWHFREGIIAKSQDLLGAGGSLLFPLPRIEVVS